MRTLAYLDPGSGSILLQTLLGGVAAIAVSIKLFGKKVYQVLFFWKDHDEEEPAAKATPDPTPAEPDTDTVKEPA
jgi:hypothetical protein